MRAIGAGNAGREDHESRDQDAGRGGCSAEGFGENFGNGKSSRDITRGFHLISSRLYLFEGDSNIAAETSFKQIDAACSTLTKPRIGREQPGHAGVARAIVCGAMIVMISARAVVVNCYFSRVSCVLRMRGGAPASVGAGFDRCAAGTGSGAGSASARLKAVKTELTDALQPADIEIVDPGAGLAASST
ncbi:MAG: hypothetical protein ABSF86_17795 [Steroidobacteraceae bacterium]